MLAAEGEVCNGLILLAYPLHPAGKPERLRDAHLPDIQVPVLCFNGTRDSLCQRDLMEQVLVGLSDRFRMHWLEGADHGYKVLKRSGRTQQEVFEEVGSAGTSRWLVPTPHADPDTNRDRVRSLPALGHDGRAVVEMCRLDRGRRLPRVHGPDVRTRGAGPLVQDVQRPRRRPPPPPRWAGAALPSSPCTASSSEAKASSKLASTTSTRSESPESSETKHDFTVTEASLEMAETAMNAKLMKDLATLTNGKFFREEDLHKLPEAIKAERAEVRSRMEVALGTSPLYFILIMLVVTIEWVVRKFSYLK